MQGLLPTHVQLQQGREYLTVARTSTRAAAVVAKNGGADCCKDCSTSSCWYCRDWSSWQMQGLLHGQLLLLPKMKELAVARAAPPAAAVTAGELVLAGDAPRASATAVGEGGAGCFRDFFPCECNCCREMQSRPLCFLFFPGRCNHSRGGRSLPLQGLLPTHLQLQQGREYPTVARAFTPASAVGAENGGAGSCKDCSTSSCCYCRDWRSWNLQRLFPSRCNCCKGGRSWTIPLAAAAEGNGVAGFSGTVSL